MQPFEGWLVRLLQRSTWLGIWALLTAGAIAPAQTNSLRLWYERPATNGSEALPLGNGRLGAMIFGGVTQERLQLNEATLYSGYPGYRDLKLSVTNDYQRVAGLIAARHYAEADDIIQHNWRGNPPGHYQPLGDLWLEFEGQAEATNYRRELDLNDAICRISYECGGVHFSRGTFVSFPDQVIVLHLTTPISSQPLGADELHRDRCYPRRRIPGRWMR